MSMSTLVRQRKALAAVPAAGLVLLLAGCGGTTASASSAPDNSANTSTNNAGAGNGAGNGQGRAFPGAQGKIADISGKTLQVQNDTTQTAVTYTSATKMSQTVSASKTDLAVGKCVSVRPMQNGTDATQAPATPDDSTPIEAGSVTISDATNGSCNGGFGGGAFAGGARGNGGFRGQRTNAGTGAPTDQAPTGGQNPGAQGRGQGPRGGFGGGANGTITAINGDTITVESQRPQFNQANASGTAASSTPTMTTVTRTVTLTSSTTYTKTESASASDLKVGKCVTALGSTDSNGTLAATTIALRPADASGSCTAGMFGGFGGRRNGGATNGAPATTTS